MNVTDRTADQVQKSYFFFIFTSCFCGIITLVNIVFIVIGFKILKKNFQNLVILVLCFGNVQLGVTLFIFSLESVVESIKASVTVCLLQTFVLWYSVLLVYALIFLQCLQRYLTVRSFNFGTNTKFTEYKNAIVSCTVIVTCIFVLAVTVAMPHEYSIEACSCHDLYEEYCNVYKIIIFSPLSILLILSIFILCLTSFKIWIMFFKTRNKKQTEHERRNAVQHNGHSSIEDKEENTKTEKPSTGDKKNTTREMQNMSIGYGNKTMFHKTLTSYTNKTTLGRTKTRVTNIDKNVDQQHTEFFITVSGEPVASSSKTGEPVASSMNTTHRDISGKFLQVKNSRRDTTNIFDKIKTNAQDKKISSKGNRKTEKKHSLSISDREVTTKYMNGISTITTNQNNGSAAKNEHRPVDIQNKDQTIKAWEIRAFVTSLVLAGTTLVCTGPFFISQCIDIAGISLPQTTRMVLFFLVFFIALLNPFVYAWRLPEVRQEFSKRFQKGHKVHPHSSNAKSQFSNR